jgi:alkanesulfonate monooxygenase SsuD/methylene tetrahydromethanopterin reductase-like flavin-dependent oxidoreductase (luciferase family)
VSKTTVTWAAQHRYPYVMLDSELPLTAQVFDLYREQARDFGFEAGTHHLGYMFKVHVDETEELAYSTGRKLIEGAGNIFLDGSNGKPNPWALNLPGLNARNPQNLLPTVQAQYSQRSRGLSGHAHAAAMEKAAATAEEHDARRRNIFDGLLDRYACIVGTPETVIPKIRHVLETLRPGNVFFWDGDGDFTHEDTMRGIRLMGEYVLPAVRAMAAELELYGAFEVDPRTNQRVEAAAVR